MAATIQAHLTPANLLPCVKDEQREILEKNFQANRNPSEFEVEIIATEVGLNSYDVKCWFQHRLACWRQQQGLPANGGSVTD
ncbi:homeodomain-only protein-like [Octopus bimaculoides]|uniref:homeodomain-only protein-like n=1 Tax=Octopus bimaculoides TaxID=37653 RepID=UPI00071C4A14|nr:homeodomain-only protein-like [Octopus bimaculoides]|eukprot:XP_014791048.1 PREDICTED: homeodomain-only protein-like [Octopus bimaculoides]